MIKIRPKAHIKNIQELQDFQCKVCYQISEKPLACKGCHLKICSECFCSIKQHYGKCPQRCSAEFLVQPCKDIKFQFFCPFNKQACKQPLNSLDEFKMHCQKCPFITAQWLQFKNKAQKYQCPKGHSLYFLQPESLAKLYGYNYYYKIIKIPCDQCGEVGYTRNICLQCSTKQKHVLFCSQCCKLPCTKSSCPHSHPFVDQQVSGMSKICDVCGKPCLLFGKISKKDHECNFDICQNCYDCLPEENPLVPLKANLLALNMLINQIYSQEYDF